MVDKKAISFAIGLLVFGISAIVLPLSPALQVMPLSDIVNKYLTALQASGVIAVIASFVMFYLGYKNKVF